MAVFLTVMAIAGVTFNNIISIASKYSRSEESNIEGVVGLEIMRHDIEQMGFGLPWTLLAGSTITYSEAEDTDGKKLNDASSSMPRAFVGLNDSAKFTSDLIGIKATTVGRSKVSQRWTYINYHNYSTASGPVSRPIVWPSGNLQKDNKVIAVRSNFNEEDDDHVLMNDGGTFSFGYSADGGIPTKFLPENDQQMHMVYGIEEKDITPRMPFNRADFFIKVPDASTGGALPAYCEKDSTAVLYKAVVSHTDGSYIYLPLLDCVADMQVVLGWDASEGGKANSVNAYSSMPAADGTVAYATPAGVAADIKKWLTSAQGIREHLKVVKVYILAQEGRRDPRYVSPQTKFIVGKDCRAAETSDIDCGKSFTKEYTLSSNQMNYKWKLYRIIAKPRNLVSNQR